MNPAATPGADPARHAFPARIDDLATAAPRDAAVFVHLPGYRWVLEASGAGADLEALLGEMAREAAPRLGLSQDDVIGVVKSVRHAGAFAQMQSDGEPAFAGLLVFEDAAKVEALFSKVGLVQREPHHFEAKLGDHAVHVGWVRELGLMVVSPRQDLVDATFDVLTGERPSFAASADAPKGREDLFVSLDLDALEQNEILDEGSRALIALPRQGPAVVDVRALGERIPRVGDVIAPSAHARVGSLPSGAASAFGLSIARAKGKTLRDVVAEAGRVEKLGKEAATGIDAFLRSQAKLSLDDLDRALGDEVFAALYYPPAPKRPAKQPAVDPNLSATLLGGVAIRNEKLATMLVDAAAATLGRSTKGLVASPGKLAMPVGNRHVKIEVRKDVIAFAVGSKVDVDRRLASFGGGAPTLGADPGFAERRKTARKESLAFYYVDFGALSAFEPGLGDVVAKLGRLDSFSDVTALPDIPGLDLRTQTDGAATLFGGAAALGTHAVRRYIAASKVIEAKSTTGAIARGAVAAWEREHPAARSVVHRLCESASPVPADVPKAAKYEPSPQPGKDFLTGDDSKGWRCLRFELSSPMRFRYDYRAGGGYKGPARGGPDPGPRGFEASAEGDLDGDGKTSLFTITGKPGKGGAIELSALFVADEDE